MFKSQIRENNKNKRQILSQQQIHEKSQLLTENFWKSSFIETISTLHIFLPIKSAMNPIRGYLSAEFGTKNLLFV